MLLVNYSNSFKMLKASKRISLLKFRAIVEILNKVSKYPSSNLAELLKLRLYIFK